MDQSQEDTHLLATLAQYADMTARAPLLKYKALCCIPKSECKGASSSVTFKYLAEGAANVVFSIHPWMPSDGNPFLFVDLDARSDPSRPKHAVLPRNPFLNKVIRISKGVPKSLNSQTIIEGFAKDVKPLFQSARARIHDEYEEDRKSRPPPRWNTWDHDRRARTLNPFANPYYRDSYVEAQLPKPSLPDVPLPGDESFEEHLMDHEGLLLSAPALQELLSLVPRAERQRISVSPTQTPQWGILLPNMSSVPEKSVTLEIKPKWLVQSPNAPRDAYRCRNCALRASRVAQNKELSEEKGGYLCPLKLLRGERKVIQAWVRSKVEKAFEEDTPDNQLVESITERTTDYLIAGKGHQLLAHIGHLQTHLDRRGVLCNPDGPDHREIEHRLRLAMTLRDCSLYIKIPYGRYSDVEITSKLGDLDFKSPEKVSDWAQKEESLRNGGWYTSLTQLEGLNCLISQAWKREVPY